MTIATAGETHLLLLDVMGDDRNAPPRWLDTGYAWIYDIWFEEDGKSLKALSTDGGLAPWNVEDGKQKGFEWPDIPDPTNSLLIVSAAIGIVWLITLPLLLITMRRQPVSRPPPKFSLPLCLAVVVFVVGAAISGAFQSNSAGQLMLSWFIALVLVFAAVNCSLWFVSLRPHWTALAASVILLLFIGVVLLDRAGFMSVI